MDFIKSVFFFFMGYKFGKQSSINNQTAFNSFFKNARLEMVSEIPFFSTRNNYGMQSTRIVEVYL